MHTVTWCWLAGRQAGPLDQPEPGYASAPPCVCNLRTLTLSGSEGARVADADACSCSSATAPAVAAASSGTASSSPASSCGSARERRPGAAASAGAEAAAVAPEPRADGTAAAAKVAASVAAAAAAPGLLAWPTLAAEGDGESIGGRCDSGAALARGPLELAPQAAALGTRFAVLACVAEAAPGNAPGDLSA